jgi:hypothetical protein
VNVSYQDQVLGGGTIIGHGQLAVWAATIENHESEPRRKQELGPQLRDVLVGARPNLSAREAQALEELLADYQDVFKTGSGDCGRIEKVYHRIDTGDTRPIRQPPRSLSLVKQALVTNLLEDMKSKGVIEESDSPWSSPVVLVRKKDGSLHFCLDYQRLNDITKKTAFRSRGLMTPWIRRLGPSGSPH